MPTHASRSRTLGTCLVAAVVIVLGGGRAALALPEGMVVQGGQLVLQQQDANNAVLHQGTPRAAADFNSFNIDAGQRLQILQPDATSTLLGRITNGQLTEIHGRLDANGRVLLINPAGVLVGPGGVINTAAFTASTLHVDHQRFMQGGPVELKTLGGSNPAASVINRGTINVADGGFAALVAPRVLNAGVITARLGQIQLASGTAATLDISGDGLLSVTLDPALAGSITNAGTLRGSYVRLGGGDAAILAAATVHQAGLIEARSLDELTGGSITIEGQHISVTSGAVLDASGATGGGQILVGGSWQNSDPSVRQATTTRIEAGAVLDASATLSGHGGTVVAWSDIHNPAGATTVAGNLRARGGANRGDGGRIETSGYRLNVDGIQISATAAFGRSGEWLLDPYNITIDNTGGTAFTNPFTATATSTILASDITSALNAGNNVSISTGTGSGSGDITVNASISKTLGASATLSLIAAGNIIFNESINLASAGNLSLQAGDQISQATGKTLTVSGTTAISAYRNISLSQNNDFTGSITAASTIGNIGLKDINDLNINTLSSSSALDLYASGAVSSTGAVTTGTSSVIYGNSITLNNAANSFGGDIAVMSLGFDTNTTITNNRPTSLGSSTILGNLNLTSNGNISQSGAVYVAGTTTLSAGSSNNITLPHSSNNFNGIVSVASGNNVTISTGAIPTGILRAGAITVNGAVTLGAPTQVVLNGTIRTNGGAITIDNGSGNNTAVKLGAGSTLDTTNGSVSPYTALGAPVTINGSVTAASSAYGLTIYGGTNGDVSINGNIGAIGDGNVSPTSVIIGGNDISVAAIDGVSAISLAATDTTGDIGSITLSGTTYRALSSLVLSSGVRNLNDPVTNPILLAGGAAGSTTTLSTEGGIQLEISGAINLNSRNLSLDTTGGGVAPLGAQVFLVNDAIDGAGSLTINAGSGSSERGVVSINHLSGAIGATTPLTAVTLTNAYQANFGRNITAGTLTLSDTDTNIVLQGKLTLSDLSGGLVTTAQPYALSLLSGSNETSAIAGSTTFLNTGALILGNQGDDGFSFANGVVATAPASIQIVGTVGASTGVITLGDSNTPVNVVAAIIGGNSTGAISLGPVTIAESGGLTVGTGSVANSVSLSSVSGNNTGYPETLTINTSGSATVSGVISNLGNLTISKAAGITFSDAVTASTISIGTIPLSGSAPNLVTFQGDLNTTDLTTSSGNYGIEFVGSNNTISQLPTFNNTYYVLLGDNTNDTILFQGGLVIPSTLTAGSYPIGTIRTSGQPISISRSVLTGNTTFDTTNNGASPAASLSLVNTTAGNHNLTLRGNTSLSGTFTGVKNLQITGTADLDLPSGAINTSGSQTYTGDVILNGDTTLTATGSLSLANISASGSGPYALTLASTGTTTLGGSLSGISNLVLNGPTAINTTSITTTGSQAYNAALTLLSNTTLSSTTAGAFTFASTINGARALTITTAGNIVFNGAIGATTPIASLTINSGTTGAISFNSNASTTVSGSISAIARNIVISSILSSSNGNILLTGNASTATTESFNGVQVGTGGRVRTISGNITIEGRGGNAVIAGSPNARATGVYLSGGGEVSAGGAGTISITGIGGITSDPAESAGINISANSTANGISKITSAGGSITLVGTAGGAANSTQNAGVQINNFAQITAGGTGAVTITGTATETGGSDNVGVIVVNDPTNAAALANPTAAITSAGGNITITGMGTSTGAAVVLRNAGRVSSGGSGNVTLVADSVVIDSNSSAAAGSITAGAAGGAMATLRPRSAGTLVNLGGADVLSGSPLTLGLSTAELGRVTAGTLTVGSTSAGAITLSQPLTLPDGVNLALLSGAGLSLDGALSTSAGGNFSAALSGAISQSAALDIAGSTTLSTGSGNITLLNTGNRFAVVPLTISSSGIVLIYPCSATSCVDNSVVNGTQARQDILTTNPALTQSNQVNALSAQSDPVVPRSQPAQQPGGSSFAAETSGNQRINLGQGNLDFDSSSSTCASAGGCDLQSSTDDSQRLKIAGVLPTKDRRRFSFSQLSTWLRTWSLGRPVIALLPPEQRVAQINPTLLNPGLQQQQQLQQLQQRQQLPEVQRSKPKPLIDGIDNDTNNGESNKNNTQPVPTTGP